MLPISIHSDAEVTACFEKDIAALVGAFSEKETSGKQSLQQMLSSDPATFQRASIEVLARAAVSAGSRYLLHLLRKHNLLIEALADPLGPNGQTAIAAARTICRLGIPIDAELERVLGATLSATPSAVNVPRLVRLLDVLAAASAQPRFYLFQTELLNYPDSSVRSKSALLIACTSKSAALVGRLLLDEDPRVQANAVEALWTFDPVEARPLLLQAARSKLPRVAGNAAVGLYRGGDLSSVRFLFSMAREDDPVRRTSAAWAMGEIGDPRFLPFLTAWFPNSSGDEKVNVIQALGRIRRREKSLAEAGTIEIRTWDARVDTRVKDGARHLVVSLWSADKADLSALEPAQFAIWEGGALVEDYQITAHQNPVLAISGFVLPRFSSVVDPYRIAIVDAVERCLKYKRADDLWRLDRYLTEPRNAALGEPLEKAALPYDESLLGPHAKIQQRGFLAAPEALQKILESSGPRERAADDAIAAFDRQSDAMVKFSGKRKLFLFLSSECGRRMERTIARLTSFIANERIALHGIAPKGAAVWEDFQALCLASEGGTFNVLSPEEVPGEVERIYAQSINRFDVTYRAPGPMEPAEGRIQITSGSGCGRGSFSFAGG
jgi:hypothetical protein